MVCDSSEAPASHRFLCPPLYPCHYIVQRAGYMGLWLGLHSFILIYFLIKYTPHEPLEGLNQATQYGIVASIMGILIAMSPTFLGLLQRTWLSRVVTFEKRIHAHKFISYILFIWTVIHSSLHYWTGVVYADSAHITRLFIFWEDRLGVTGQVMWIIFLIMGVASLPSVRRAYYEVFYYLHHLYIANIAILYLHSEKGMALRYVTGPLAIFTLDYLYRAARSYPIIWSRRARIRYVRMHPCDVVEIGFDRKELLKRSHTGQFVKMCIPELGIFQWHPLTLTSTPNTMHMFEDGKCHPIWRVHFKVAGNWTMQLSRRLHRATERAIEDVEDYAQNPAEDEARAGCVVNDIITPTIVPLRMSTDSGSVNSIETDPFTPTSIDSDVALPKPGISVRSKHNKKIEGKWSVGLVRNKELSTVSPPESGTTSLFDSAWGDQGAINMQIIAKELLPTVLIDGPYNAPMESFFRFKTAILVAAGIGITPYMAAIDRILEMCDENIPTRTTQTTSDALVPQKTYLVWVFRDINLLSLLNDSLQRLRDHPRARELVVPCLYVTGGIAGMNYQNTESDVFERPMVQLDNDIRVSLGRPPIARMILYMANKHPNTAIGAFCCAPKQLNSTVRSSIHNTNAAVAHQGTRMVMYSECFSN